jgi:hypothetical protein
MFFQSFDVIAIDGDTGINTKICYRIEFEADKDCEYSPANPLPFPLANLFHLRSTDGEYISIGEESGIIDVKAIDRDELKNEFYPFEVRLCLSATWTSRE